MRHTLSLHVWLLASAPTPICWQRKPTRWWLQKPQIYEYSRISLRTTSLEFEPVAFGSKLGLWDIQNPWPSRQYRSWVAAHGVGLKLIQTLVGHSYKFCITIALVYHGRRTDCRLSVLWLVWYPGFSSHGLLSTFACQRDYKLGVKAPCRHHLYHLSIQWGVWILFSIVWYLLSFFREKPTTLASAWVV